MHTNDYSEVLNALTLCWKSHPRFMNDGKYWKH
jgi:hypothetical protein